jgi:hypothetical protein
MTGLIKRKLRESGKFEAVGKGIDGESKMYATDNIDGESQMYVTDKKICYRILLSYKQFTSLYTHLKFHV